MCSELVTFTQTFLYCSAFLNLQNFTKSAVFNFCMLCKRVGLVQFQRAVMESPTWWQQSCFFFKATQICFQFTWCQIMLQILVGTHDGKFSNWFNLPFLFVLHNNQTGACNFLLSCINLHFLSVFERCTVWLVWVLYCSPVNKRCYVFSPFPFAWPMLWY